MAMMAMTTSNSINVNLRREGFSSNFVLAIPRPLLLSSEYARKVRKSLYPYLGEAMHLALRAFRHLVGGTVAWTRIRSRSPTGACTIKAEPNGGWGWPVASTLVSFHFHISAWP